MALDSGLFLVTKEIAQRSGMIATRHRIADGRFVLNNRDLARIRLTSEEFVTGLQGIEKVDSKTAKTLIRKNKFVIGEDTAEEKVETPVEAVVETPVEENTETLAEEVVEPSEEAVEVPAEETPAETEDEQVSEETQEESEENEEEITNEEKEDNNE